MAEERMCGTELVVFSGKYSRKAGKVSDGNMVTDSANGYKKGGTIFYTVPPPYKEIGSNGFYLLQLSSSVLESLV